MRGLSKLETNLDGRRSFSRILFAFHHSWKWVGFELSLNWDANELKKARDNRFFLLTWSINLSCCPVLSASFKFLAKRSNIGRKKTWNLVVIDRLYSSVLFWYLLTINCLNFVLVPSPRRLRKSEHFFLRPSTEELQSLSLRIFGMLSCITLGSGMDPEIG